MSQYQQEQYYGQPSMEAGPTQPKTSAMAITSLVMALIGIVPCCGLITGPVGALLGIISMIRIGSNPMLKGKGLALIGILLGVVFTAAQIGGGWYVYNEFMRPIFEGPRRPLTAASQGDIAKFKSYFVGAGATASDEEAQAFIDELEKRYGKFVSTSFDKSGSAPPAGASRQPRFTMPYVFEFQNATMHGDATYEMTDQMSQQLVQKWSEIVVNDADKGDLTYPPPAATPAAAPDAAKDESSDTSSDSASGP